MPSLACVFPVPGGIVVCVHLLSLRWAGVGCQGSFEQGILHGELFFTIRPRTVLFIILLQVMNKEHCSLSVREAIMILVALNAQYCIAPRQVPPRGYIWLPGETTGFFRLILVSLCLSSNRFLFCKYAGHFRSSCGWTYIQVLRTSSHRTFSVVSGHSTVQIK